MVQLGRVTSDGRQCSEPPPFAAVTLRISDPGATFSWAVPTTTSTVTFGPGQVGPGHVLSAVGLGEADGRRGSAAGLAVLPSPAGLVHHDQERPDRGSAKTPGPTVHYDLVQRQFSAPIPEVVWVSEITERPTVEGKRYCCAIKDLFSRRIAGHSIGERMTADLAVSALPSAIAGRQPPGNVTATESLFSLLQNNRFTAGGGPPATNPATRSSSGTSTPITAAVASAPSASSPLSSSSSPSPHNPATTPTRHDEAQPPSTKDAADPTSARRVAPVPARPAPRAAGRRQRVERWIG